MLNGLNVRWSYNGLRNSAESGIEHAKATGIATFPCTPSVTFIETICEAIRQTSAILHFPYAISVVSGNFVQAIK